MCGVQAGLLQYRIFHYRSKVFCLAWPWIRDQESLPRLRWISRPSRTPHLSWAFQLHRGWARDDFCWYGWHLGPSTTRVQASHWGAWCYSSFTVLVLVWVSLAGVSLSHGELVWWHGYLTTSRTQTFLLWGLKNLILWTFDWNNKGPSATSPPFELIAPATCRAFPGRSSGFIDGPRGGLPCGWHQRDYDHGWQQNHGRSHQSLLRTT